MLTEDWGLNANVAQLALMVTEMVLMCSVMIVVVLAAI